MTGAPRSRDELLARARDLAGYTLGELADRRGIPLPASLRRDKGWVGQFIETLLGASSGSLPQPDFPELGVELKTLPVTRQGKPLESTYVSVVPLTGTSGHWRDSIVCHKLARVLWLPIVAERQIPLPERIIGTGFLWSPTPDIEAILRADWEQVMERVARGEVESLSARQGEILQVRPKAASASALTETVGSDGETCLTLPRGFYLRPEFTGHLLQQAMSAL